MKRTVLTLVALFVLAAASGAVAVRLGVYDVGATSQHTALTFQMFEYGKLWSIRQRAKDTEPPDLSEPSFVDRGISHYQRHCSACHGAPGVARSDLGKGMTPVPRNLVQTGRQWTAAEIFWVVKNGIQMTGMPGWDYRMPDDEIWAIVAFVKRMPDMSAGDFQQRLARLQDEGAGSGDDGTDLEATRDAAAKTSARSGDSRLGSVAIRQYACTACHIVPGIVGPSVMVGPPLSGMAKRRYIAGVMTNTTDNMVRWITDPTSVDPLTAMPNLNVSEVHARDIAAYLSTLE